MKKSKKTLDELKIKSFVTSMKIENGNTIKGGGPTGGNEPGCGFREYTDDPKMCHTGIPGI